MQVTEIYRVILVIHRVTADIVFIVFICKLLLQAIRCTRLPVIQPLRDFVLEWLLIDKHATHHRDLFANNGILEACTIPASAAIGISDSRSPTRLPVKRVSDAHERQKA